MIQCFLPKCKMVLLKAVFLLAFFAPILFLKIRAGISFKESIMITKMFVLAAIRQKKYLQAIKVFFLLFFKISWKEFEPDYELFPKREYTIPCDNSSIGRWYSVIPQEEKKTEEKPDLPNMKYFSIGREAINHILQINSFERKVALLPNFTCFTVLSPFLQGKWELCFYRYNKDMSVDTEYFYEVFQKEKPSLCIFQPLSGMGFLETEKELIAYARKNGCMTVVDQTQDTYNIRNDQNVDYYCGSLRKWYPFPDGSFLYSEKYEIDGCDALRENFIYRTAMGLCMFAAHLKAAYNNPYFKYLYKFMWIFSTTYISNAEITTHTMSSYSRKILAEQDEKYNAQRRIENFNYIYQGIAGLGKVKPVCSSIDRLTGVPLCFHVYADNRQRFSAYLSTKGIVTQLLWSKPPYISKLTLDETSEYIYGHIVSLPCDQRFDVDDMKRMVDAIRAYDHMS